MRISLIVLSLALCLGVGYRAWSEDKHDHGKQEKKKDEHGHDNGEEEHAEEEGHSHAPKEAKGEDSHDHSPGEKEGEKGHDHAEGEEEGHAEGDGHGHAEGGGEGGHGGHEEGGGVVGPEKGIVEKGPLGIKLSEEAVKTINPETVTWQSGSISIPYQGLVRIKDTKSVYRVRNGFFKRVPAVVQSRQGDRVTVTVAGLQAGDKIVISQAGFLRIAEVITEEGASHSHAH